MATIPTELRGVRAITKANVYFDGKVISHSLFLPDGSKKTLGIIYPGKYHFGTDKAEGMEIVAGKCAVMVDGTNQTKTYNAGDTFNLPGKSGFDIEVKDGLCEYICTFID